MSESEDLVVFFEKDNISFGIIDVLRFTQGKFKHSIWGRNFDVLSYRVNAKTTISTDTKKLTLGRGSVCFMPAGVKYTRATEHDDIIAVHINTDYAESSEIEHFVTAHPERMEELFLKILELWNLKGSGYKYKCTAVFYEILAECYAENYKPEVSYGAISASVEYMREHFRDPKLSISDAAAKSFMSEVYFRKKFKECFGTSPAKYLISMRIAHAAMLISAAHYSLKEVALLSGYTDYPYFSAEFKRIKGVNPSEYVYNY